MANFKNLQANDRNGELSKPWFISYYYRHPETGVFNRFRETADINRINSVKDRREALFALKQAKETLLSNGWSPYQEYSVENFIEKAGLLFLTLNDAIDKVLEHKKLHIKPTSYSTFKSRVENFRSFLDDRKLLKLNVKEISKRYVLEYLDLKTRDSKVSNRTRNNMLIDIKSMFSTMVDMEFIEINPTATIKKLPTESERNILYSQAELSAMHEWLKDNDPYLLFFCKAISYTLIRPVELTRLKVGDVDLEKRVIRLSATKTKNKSAAEVPIMDIIYSDFLAMNLQNYPSNYYLFSAIEIPNKKGTTRDFFTNRFSKVKKELKFSKNHTMYGLKHTFISELIRNNAPEKDVRRLSRHKSNEAFQAYIRQFNTERPAELSQYYKLNF